MAASIRAAIMRDLLTTVAVMPEINGAVDDTPWDYAQPPLPAAGFGIARHPYAYIFESEERPDAEPYVGMYDCALPVTIECTFEYSRTDGAAGLKPTGRELLAAIQAAVMRDPNRGGNAERTTETLNTIEETAVDGLGVVVWQGTLAYVRNAQRPDSREADLSAAA